MRSTRPPLAALAALVDEATVDHPGPVLLHVEGPVADPGLAVRPLGPGVHPFDVLAGFSAPPAWTAFGIRARGRGGLRAPLR